MRGLLSLWPSSWQKKRLHTQGALMQRVDGVALVHLLWDHPKNLPVLTCCHFQPVDKLSNASRVAANLVKKYGLEKENFVGILDPGSYLLFPADKPSVPEEEWGQNLKWKIRDRIDYPPEQAVVEVFSMPSRGDQKDSDKVYVSVARERDVQRQVDFFRNVGVSLSSLTIQELTLGYLTDPLLDHSQGLALLYLGYEGGIVMVRRDKKLYLARSLEVGLKRIAQCFEPSLNHETIGFGGDTVLEDMVVELRRTFDYYERHFKQLAVEVVFVIPTEIPVQGLLPFLTEKLGISAHYLELDRMCRLHPMLERKDINHCLPIISAALAYNGPS